MQLRTVATAIVLSLILTFGARGADLADGPTAELQKAANDFKVKLLPGAYARYEYGLESFETAIIDGFQNVPAAAYQKGVDVGIVRYHSDEDKLPDGYYKWSVHTDNAVTAIGRQSAVTELRDKSGMVVFSQPIAIEALSLTVAQTVPDPGVIVTFSSQPVTKGTKAFNDATVQGIVCCKNGMCGQCFGKGCDKIK
ncbi:hypothetical protein [Mesorhizobium sp.]|uniref:hypothetical protein n=1 Tax=Mesorhizobium sp. TaxID=1871066 RepID=UPI000FE70462|nr:hypothetical protein [Mesorhizobium sp.]RWA81299.1 MAG: hypothetical protein EOQ30_19170 [Mesorhizobium sp.]